MNWLMALLVRVDQVAQCIQVKILKEVQVDLAEVALLVWPLELCPAPLELTLQVRLESQQVRMDVSDISQALNDGHQGTLGLDYQNQGMQLDQLHRL